MSTKSDADVTAAGAVDTSTFQPKIGFKTRYGMVKNPFSRGGTVSTAVTDAEFGGDLSEAAQNNVYYRLVRVDNLM